MSRTASTRNAFLACVRADCQKRIGSGSVLAANLEVIPDNSSVAGQRRSLAHEMSHFVATQARDGAPAERAQAIGLRTSMRVQAICRALFTSLMIAAAVGSVRPPASVVGTPRASASTR
jgi:hypothetical protein